MTAQPFTKEELDKAGGSEAAAALNRAATFTHATMVHELAALAVAVSHIAPRRRSGPSVSCTIPWDAVETIRATMEKGGMDWKAHHTKRSAR